MYFQSKTIQTVQGLQAFAFCVVNINSTVFLKNFEDLKDLTFSNILKEKLVMSCLLGFFYLKIVWVQIPIKFYRTVEKVETCDGNGQTL